MNHPKPISQARSADLRGSWPALQRAAERARAIAAQMGTDLVVSEAAIPSFPKVVVGTAASSPLKQGDASGKS